MRRIFAKRMKFFEAKSVGTFNASDSRQSRPLRIKRVLAIAKARLILGRDENPFWVRARSEQSAERGASRAESNFINIYVNIIS